MIFLHRHKLICLFFTRFDESTYPPTYYLMIFLSMLTLFPQGITATHSFAEQQLNLNAVKARVRFLSISLRIGTEAVYSSTCLSEYPNLRLIITKKEPSACQDLACNYGRGTFERKERSLEHHKMLKKRGMHASVSSK